MPTRRQFIRRTAMAFGGYLVVSDAACKPGAREKTPPPSPQQPAEPKAALPAEGLQSLAPAQFQLIAAVCERILPRDEDPGATDLGCAVYIDRAMADPDARSTWKNAASPLKR
ncbi:MAG TPA: gluconate 2-dehydrogenase subunit 3 family protein, partial [Myxococcales bacterium]|nr:gluconate 2-dehydrogenase subunit 3 family protein [Myxococcales bacterium]